MSRPQSFRDLDVWRRSMDFVVDIHALTSRFPRHELFGLTEQTRRAALSVPSNIAEGNGRFHRGEYAHHVSIARGSVAELWTDIEIARRLCYVSDAEASPRLEMADGLSRMLLRLMRSLRGPGTQGA